MVSLFGTLTNKSVAFNALIGSSIVLQQLSFAIPIALLVYRKRPTEFLPRNRQFRMPEPLAWFANVFSLMFTVIVLVFFNFPSFLPVTASTMSKQKLHELPDLQYSC